MTSENSCLKAIIIALMAYRASLTTAEFFSECTGVDKSQKYVVSFDNCAKYVYCDGENSFEGECLGEYYFNVKEGKCDERAAVVCNTDGGDPDVASSASSPSGGWVVNLSSIATTETESAKENSLSNNSNKSNNSVEKLNIDNRNNTTNNIWNPTASQLQVKQQPQHAVSPGETVTGLAQNAIDMGNTGFNTGEAVAKSTQCPMHYRLRNLVTYLPNTQSCLSYYTCYNGIAIPMICPRNMYFNELTMRCERQDNYYCPYDRPVRLVCNPGVYDYIPHSSNCGYYYYCSNGYFMILQCPFDFTWHYERRSCVHRSQSKCFSKAIAKEMLS